MDSSSTMLYAVIGFLIMNLLVGLWAGKGVKDFKDYAIGNKKWSVGALVMTYIATILEGASLLRGLRKYAIVGISGFASPIGMFLGFTFKYLFLAPKMYRFNGCITMGDVAERLFGKKAKIYTGIVGALMSIVFYGLELEVLSFIFEKFLNFDKRFALYGSAIIIILYTVTGGIRSVVGTDIIQFLFISAMLFILSYVSTTKAGGTTVVLNSLSPDKWIFLKKDLIPSMVSIAILNSFFSAELICATVFPRVLMTTNKNKLQNLFLYSALCYLVYTIARFIIASSLSLLSPGSINSLIEYACNELLSEPMKIIVILGIISLSLSSADSFLHGSSTSLTNDLVRPILGEKFNDLRVVRLIVALLGIGGIVFAKSSYVYLDLSLLYSIVTPTLAFPLTISIIGLKPSKKGFWMAAIFGFTTFLVLNTGVLGDILQEFGTLIGSLVNALTYLLFHFKENSGFVLADDLKNSTPQREFKPNAIKNFFTSLINLVTNFNSETKKLVSGYTRYYTLFGVFYCISTFIPYLLLSGDELINDQIMYFKAIGIVLCCLLMTHSFWPNNTQKYLPAFWYITLTYCLPFMSTVMLFISHGAIEYTINIAINIMFLILLADWKSVLGIAAVGISTAIICYKGFLQNNHVENVFDFDTKYLLIYQLIFGSMVGLLFARKKQVITKNLTFKSAFLDKFRENIIKSNQKSLRIIKNIEESYKEEVIDPVKKINEIVQLLKDKNYSNCEKESLVLQGYLEANAEKVKAYCVLNPTKIKLRDFVADCEKLLRATDCENVSILLRTKLEKVQWDRIATLKVIWKLVNDCVKKLKATGNDLDDLYLTIIFSDTKLIYTEDNNQTYNETKDALCITITEDAYVAESTIFKTYNKELIDPEKIPQVNYEDEEQLDIEYTVDAHFGVLQNLGGREKLLWNCILPTMVYSIRSQTLDMDKPIEAYYNWPAADALEKELLSMIAQQTPRVDHLKLKKAVDIVKKYHFHQKRKSGEPYYMHPMYVTKFVLDIIQDETSKVYNLLQDNQETVVLGSLLHDILEDTAMHRIALNNIFGTQITDVVKEITKIDYRERSKLLSNKQAFKKLILQEPIPVCIKLADRLHNLLTIDGHHDQNKRIKIAQETLNFFIEPALNFGLNTMAAKLTEISNYIINNGKLEGYIEQ
jgi:Na+/proline symporter